MKRHRTVVSSKPIGVWGCFSPQDFLALMWPDEILAHLVMETNKIFTQQGKKPLTLDELKRYFGHVLVIAVLGLHRNEDLWRRKGISINYPGQEFKMGYKRWRLIHANLKWDIDEVHGMLRHAFQSHLNPGTCLCVDEARIPCKHKGCPCLSYNPSKPAKWALEGLTLSDSTKYLWDFTNPATLSPLTPFQWLLACGQLLQQRGIAHHITADKRFSNLQQGEKLLKMKIRCTLCCKPTSPTFLFRDALAMELPQWRVHMASMGDVIAATYHQKKKLNLVSTWFAVHEEPGAGRAGRVPLLDHYDTTKRWTDQFDQLVASYHYDHPHADWKITLLLGWFEWAHTNAFILRNLSVGNDISHRDFLLQCAEALLQSKQC